MIQSTTQQIHTVIPPLTTHISIMIITDMITMESMDIMVNITVTTESTVTKAPLMFTHIHMMVSGTVTIMRASPITRMHTTPYTLSSLGNTMSMVTILRMHMSITKVDSTKLTLTITLTTSYNEYCLLFL